MAKDKKPKGPSKEVLSQLEKLMPSGLSDEAHIAHREKMSHKEIEKYHQLLEKAYGPKDKRAKDMGFDDQDYYHGTHRNIKNFKPEKGSPEGFMGKAVYVTSDPNDASDNYAHPEGPDVKGKIERLAEHYQYSKDMNRTAAYEKAYKKVIGRVDSGAVLPVRVRKDNIADLTEDGSDYVDLGHEYDENGDIVKENKKLGTISANLHDALDPNDHRMNADNIMDELYEPEMTARQLFDKTSGKASHLGVDNHKGQMMSGEVGRLALQGAGYSGSKIDPSREFNMDVQPGTEHVMLNDPSHIRSKFAAYDPRYKKSHHLLAAEGGLIHKQNHNMVDVVKSLKQGGVSFSTEKGSGNPNAQAIPSEEVLRQLEAIGAKVLPHEGVYQGTKEDSFFVPNPSPKALELIKQLAVASGQHSIAVNTPSKDPNKMPETELLMMSGPDAGKRQSLGKGFTISDKVPKGDAHTIFHTEHGPKYLQYGTDEVPSIHYGPHDMQDLDPRYQGEGADKQKFFRQGKPENKFQSSYDPEAKPEGHVINGKHPHIVHHNPEEHYDMSQDPQGFMGKAQDMLSSGNAPGNPTNASDLARGLVKKAGHKGLSWDMQGAGRIHEHFDKKDLANKPKFADGGAVVPEGAIPEEQFNAPTSSPVATAPVQQPIPQGAIPEEHFQKVPEGAIPEEEYADNKEQYTTPGQTFAAHTEAAARGLLTAPLTSYLEKNVLDIPEEDIKGREESNAGTGLTEGASFLGSMFVPGGQGALLGKLGHAVESATGLYKGVEAAKAGVQAATKGADFIATADGLMTRADAVANASKVLKEAESSIPLLHRAGVEMLRQSVEFTAMQGLDEANKMVLNDPEASAEHAMAHMGLAALAGGAIGGTIGGVVSPLWKATLGPKLEEALKNIQMDTVSGIKGSTPDQGINPLMVHVLSTLGGMSKEDITNYVKHYDSINAAPEFEEVYQKTLDHVQGIYDSIENGKENLGNAKAALKDHMAEITEQFKAQGADATTANREAQRALKEATARLVSNTQETAFNASSKVSSAMETLRQKVIDGSSDAYDVLEQSNAQIPLHDFLKKTESLAREIEMEKTELSFKQAQSLRSYANGIVDSTPSLMVDGPQAKRMIQGLDKISRWQHGASQFDNAMSSAYKDLRFHLDDTLKSPKYGVPAYREAMKPVAEHTDLLKKLSSFDDEGKALSKIKNLKDAANYKMNMPLLKQLEKSTGSQFLHEIEPYANPEINARMMKNLPEAVDANKAADHLQTLKDPRTKSAMLEAIANSPQAQQVSEAQKALDQGLEAKERIKGITPDTLQGKLKSASMPGKMIEMEKRLAELPPINGMTIPEIMQSIRMKDAFNKNATRGSKHVNMYGAMMAALASSIGFHGSLESIAGAVGGGGVLGSWVDNNGPQMVKKVLDKYMSHYGNLKELSAEGTKGATHSMLQKILTSGQVPSAEGFKSGVDYVAKIRKADAALAKSVTALMTPGMSLATELPSEIDRMKLDKLVSQDEDPKQKKQVKYALGGPVQAETPPVGIDHYMPEHKQAVQATADRALQYLRQIKPKPMKTGLLDKPMPVPKESQARYERALNIAQNPNILLKYAKTGTLLPTDVMDLQSMYPKYSSQILKYASQEMAQKQVDEEHMPYATRMGVSMLMAQPLDSTMSPMSIQAAQSIYAPKQPPGPPQQQKGNRPSKMSPKSANAYKTQNQEAESDRESRD